MINFIAESLHIAKASLLALPPARMLIADSLFLFAYLLTANFFRRYAAVYIALIAPGTLLHELMHWVVALITNGQPSLPSIWPKRTRDGWMLGHVDFANPRWYNTALIALAPLLLLPLVIGIYVHSLPQVPLANIWHWIFLYVLIAAAMSTLPSRVDLRLAWKYSATVVTTIVWIAVGGIFIYFFIYIGARIYAR